MLLTLTVRSKNNNIKTAYSESFDTEKIENLIANPNTGAVPALPGAAAFTYVTTKGRNENYTVTESVAYITSASGGIGSPDTRGTASANYTAVEYGNGIKHTTVLTRDTDLVQAVASAALAFGDLAYTFPEGAIGTIAGTISFTIQGATAVNTPEVGLGHVLGAGVQTTLGAAGATMESILDGTATAAITAVGTDVAYAFDAEADLAWVDGTAAAVAMFFNCAGNWAVTENITFSDIVITLTWDFLGDV